MSYMIINQLERSALSGLSYLQQLTYFHGLKPYVDYQTGIIGIKRGVSYQSLSEALYIEPHPGIQSGSPSKNQLRRALNGLERAGLIEIKSLDSQLVFKCLLLDKDYSGKNKTDTKPTHQLNTTENAINSDKSYCYDNNSSKSNTQKSSQSDIPLNNNNNFLFFLLNAFEKFWEIYPLKADKENALGIFKKLNPSKELCAEITSSLQRQVEFYHSQQAAGIWMPAWKYPTNWLTQQCWKNTPITIEPQQEKSNETYQQHSGLQAIDNDSGDSKQTNVSDYSEAEFQKFWKLQ